MRQRLVSIGDDFWIETDGGERAYKVDGKALRLRKTLILEDAEGHELARIQERVAPVTVRILNLHGVLHSADRLGRWPYGCGRGQDGHRVTRST